MCNFKFQTKSHKACLSAIKDLLLVIIVLLKANPNKSKFAFRSFKAAQQIHLKFKFNAIEMKKVYIFCKILKNNFATNR